MAVLQKLNNALFAHERTPLSEWVAYIKKCFHIKMINCKRIFKPPRRNNFVFFNSCWENIFRWEYTFYRKLILWQNCNREAKPNKCHLVNERCVCKCLLYIANTQQLVIYGFSRSTKGSRRLGRNGIWNKSLHFILRRTLSYRWEKSALMARNHCYS